MCLAIPGKVVEIYEDRGLLMGRIDFAGTIRKASLAHVPEARVGDYVLVHVGFALSVVEAEEAERTYRLLEELGMLDEVRSSETPT